MANNGKGIGPQRLGGSKAVASNSPAKQTAKQKKNLPTAIVEAIADNKKSPAKNMNKGYGPMKTSSPAKMGAKKGDQSKSRLDYESPAKMGAKKGDQSKTRADYMSPAKKNKGMSYDIKEASNQNLSKKARKHYAENAQAANKSGYKG
jgi:hypothetical protein